MAEPRPSPIPRCRWCGYPRMGRAEFRCTECGTLAPALQPLDRAEIRAGLRRRGLMSAGVWTLMLTPMAVARLGIVSDSMGMYMAGAMLAIGVPIVVASWAAVMTIDWMPWLLHAHWSWYDGELGPWSSWKRRGLVFLVALWAHVAGAGLLGGLNWLWFPEWPAGWP